MSGICILAPAVIAAWPAISAAVAGVAAALGMSVVKEGEEEFRTHAAVENKVELSLENSEVVSETLVSGEEMVLVKGNIRVRVFRDERGQCGVCVEGVGRSKSELRAFGEEVAGKITQMFVYNKVMTEMKNKGFTVVKDEITADETVHIHVRNQAM